MSAHTQTEARRLLDRMLGTFWTVKAADDLLRLYAATGDHKPGGANFDFHGPNSDCIACGFRRNVRAVNAHEELVEALRGAIANLDALCRLAEVTPRPSGAHEFSRLLADIHGAVKLRAIEARAALALAGEE